MSKEQTKKIFKVKDNPEYTREYAVIPPRAKESNIARLEFNRIAGELVKAGGVLRNQLQDYIKAKGWSEEKEQRFDEIVKLLKEKEKEISGGGITFVKAKKLALELRKLRHEQTVLLAERGSSDGITIESQAENARFQRLLTLCLVYNDGEEQGQPVYKTVDDLLNDADSPVVNQGSLHLQEIIYKVDSDFEKKYPENKFLLQWKLVNDNLQLINGEGKLVDEEGRLINDKGWYLDAKGNRTDKDGNLVDEDGHYTVANPQPFLDEDGNPLTPPNKVE